MLLLSDQRRRRAIGVLVAFHIFIIIASNYLVQFPIELFGWKTTWGAFSFPFIFLATDLTVRLMNKSAARRIITWAMLPALLMSYMISVLFQDGQLQPLSLLSEFNLFVFRIALASFTAYVLGQLMDIQVFDRLRQHAQWWVAPAAAMFVGNLLDTFAFFFVAFWRTSDVFMAEHWIEIAAVDYAIKLLISLVFFLPLYGVLLNFLLKKLLGKEIAHK
ncbi:7-cyano-7-deazaguanine/7-aminomethyl-7-deazaguanine transporter [Pseudomonas sp. F1_0610]|uniref:7-cyano-7-deazaguanine/7-aminomethyl-7- deazaguanine transporter n=1 Tax=Pseudomonas sp. F1_0610 TaxID=3114284 RepID=UPI0039C0F907